MNTLDHELGVLGIDSRQDTVTKIEDVARATGVLVEDALDFALDVLLGSVENSRVEVPLHSNVRADDVAGLAEIDVPVEAHDIRTGHTDGVEHGTGTLDKMDNRHAPIETVDQLLGVWQDKFRIIEWRDDTAPGVKDLDDLSTGRDLRVEIEAIHLGDLSPSAWRNSSGAPYIMRLI